jgi:triphosphoribosyl-dephospho-CoA synthase
MASIDDPGLAPTRSSNGMRAAWRYRVAGAKAEAAAGYVQIRQAALPALRASRAAQASERVARLNALVALMAVLDDTCVLTRAGAVGLAATQSRAAAIVDAGGVGTLQGARALAALDDDLLARDASPGGSADLLAATLFIDALEQTGCGRPRRRDAVAGVRV